MSTSCLENLDTLLNEVITRWKIPGASMAVLHDGEIIEAVAGVSNLDTGIPVTTDTLFPYGSVTKTLTTTLTLRLAEEGKVSLDAPVSDYVPEFEPERPELKKQITVRHLLSHSSGLVGTIFRDTGWGEDAQKKNVELINEQPQYNSPGALLSYCNSGMLLLGRIAECVTGQTWHQAFQSVLAQPLGINTMVTQPEFALRHRFSVGHVRDPETNLWKLAPYPFAFASHSPAGSTPSGRARDLLSIVQLYLGQGEHAGFLSEDIIADAWRIQCESPVSFLWKGCGLGWFLFDWEDDTRIVGHDGSTMGTSSFLRIHPEKKTAVALLVNTTNGALIYDKVFPEIFRELTGVWEPGVPESAPGFIPEPQRYEGVYQDLTARLELKTVDGELRLYAQPNTKNTLPTNRFGYSVLNNYAENQFYTVGDVSKLLLKIGDEKTNLVQPYCLCTMDNGEEFFHTSALAFRRVE